MKKIHAIFVITSAALVFPLVSMSRQQTPEELTREKIFAAGPEWQQKYDGFQPAQDMLEAMKPKLGAAEEIDIYLGLWCPDSRDHVPTFLKMLDTLGTNPPVRFFGLQRKSPRDARYYFEEKQIEKVPTFVFHRAGKEIGRIVERPKAGIVEDTMDIVYK